MIILNALVPVFLVIATGWVARVSGLIKTEQWLGFERVTYYIFFPCIVTLTVVQADLSPTNIIGIGGALVGAILTMAGLLVLLRPMMQRTLRIGGPAFTSIFQGATRWNTFVGLALAGNLYGKPGLTLIAIALAAMIPLLNVLAITVLTHFAGAHGPSTRTIVLALAKNPFIWSCALGLVLNPFAALMPKMVLSYADIVGRAALGAGLLVVGSGLDIRQLARPRPAHFIAILCKLVLMPLIATFYARMLGMAGLPLGIVVIASSVPTASASYILARQLGGDAPLMAEIVTLGTILSVLTIPLTLSWLGP